MSKKTRREIKEMFKAGSQPSGQDFSDFTDSVINALDDGLNKPPELYLPLRVESNGDEQNIFDFYDDDGIHCWRINQYPADTSEGGISVQRSGFNIEDSNSETRLFIKQDNGDVGLGTANPTAKLHVVQAGSDGDSFRVDDMDEDTTPFLVSGSGALNIRVNPEDYDESLSLNVQGPVRLVNTDSSTPSLEIYKGTDLAVDTDGDSIADKPEAAFSVRKNGAVGIGTDAPDQGVLIKGDLKLGDGLEVDGDTTINGNLTVQGNVYSKSVDETLAIRDVRLGDQDEDTVTVNGEMLSAHSTGSLCINDSVNIKEKTIIGSSYYQDEAVKLSSAAPSDGLLVEGSVGIGFTSPGAKMAVNGGVHIGGDSDPGADNLKVEGDTEILGHTRTGGKFKQYFKDSQNEGYYDLLPAGSIVMWHGTSIPVGWSLCDGNNGTPDLIDKFILASATSEDAQDSVNDRSITVEHKLKNHTHTVTKGDHTHTVNISDHAHTLSSSGHTHNVPIGNHTHTVDTSHSHTIDVFTENAGGDGWAKNTPAGMKSTDRGSECGWYNFGRSHAAGGTPTTSSAGGGTVTTEGAGGGSAATTGSGAANITTTGAGGMDAHSTSTTGDSAAPSDTFNFNVVPKHYKLVFIMKL